MPRFSFSVPPSMRNLKLEKEEDDFEEIDVEKALSSSTRRYYPKIARKSKLDDFLARRTYLKFMEEKKFANFVANVKKEESDVKCEEDKNIDVENDEPEPEVASIVDINTSEQKNEAKLAIKKDIDGLREQYLQLSNLLKHYKCYSNACNTAEKTSPKTHYLNVLCYSPLCIQKAKLLSKLLTLLKQSGVKSSNAMTTKDNANMSILEQCLLGKSYGNVDNSNENILSDLMSAVACAQECDNKSNDCFVKRKMSDDGDASVKTEKANSFDNIIKSETTLEESAVPAVGNEMDIDISCNNNEENEVEIGPLKELTDPDQVEPAPETVVDNNSADNESDRPPIPKLRITRGRSSKAAPDTPSTTISPKNSESYKCSVKNDVKPMYRAAVNRRFGLQRSTKKDDKQIKEEKTEGGIVRVYSTEIPRGKVYLKRVQTSAVDKKKKRTPVKYPPCSTFHTKSKSKTIMVLPLHELKKLCRQAGHSAVSGFSHSAKPNQAVWPYPCARPLFKTCWLYRTVNLQWLTSAALQLRIMWACLRWDDMAAKAANADGKHQLTTDTEIVSLELLKHRHLGPFSERTQYLRRRVVIPLELPKTVREVTSIRSGLRKRKRAESPQNTEPQASFKRVIYG